ncbi:hypothetical protein SanaruYs_37400 [Chryseotalea sanaruensis]|uniref:Uncharacterized protein n=1 Tax=Chryseotalea sanaruensis TaxID=2482724 RepID=A0A401UF13_9BACT|nr:hypothetical protein SanaruYs_37400 [Chryseotalea sanaruensis]
MIGQCEIELSVLLATVAHTHFSWSLERAKKRLEDLKEIYFKYKQDKPAVRHVSAAHVERLMLRDF